MKVKFLSDYDSTENLLQRFRNNYPVGDNALTFTTGDDYDFAVAFNRPDEPIKPGAKLITVVQEPSFSEAFRSKFSLLHSDYLIVHDRQLFEETWKVTLGGKVIESPSLMFYHDRVPYTFFREAEKVPKDKKISMIVSSHHFRRGNYLKRIGVLDQILRSDLDIDLFGRGWYIPDDRFKGELEHKYQGLLRYEYSIAIENSCERNYISEKFFDCVLCNTVPVYHGAPNVGEVYDQRYFRQINPDSPDIVNEIREIIRHPAPLSTVNKEIYTHRYNLYTRLKEVIFGH